LNVPAVHPEVGIVDIEKRIGAVHIYYWGRLFLNWWKPGGFRLFDTIGSATRDVFLAKWDSALWRKF
jgi:hypothetical protein